MPGLPAREARLTRRVRFSSQGSHNEIHKVRHASAGMPLSGRNDEGSVQVIARRGGALALVGLLAAFLVGCGETPPPAPAIVGPAISADQLVGKWGLASYRKDEDR